MEVIHNMQNYRSKPKFVGRQSMFYYMSIWNVYVWKTYTFSGIPALLFQNFRVMYPNVGLFSQRLS